MLLCSPTAPSLLPLITKRALAKPLGDGVNCTPHHSAVAITLDHEASVGKPLGFLNVAAPCHPWHRGISPSMDKSQCHAMRFVM